MALQSSGAISLNDIATEFGGSTPHSLNEYYRNGGLVTSNNTNVPTSGTIDFADFYGAVKQVVVTISSSDTNVSVSSLFGSNFTTNIPKLLIINSGVELGATNTNNSALSVASGMSGTLTIQNAGTISGAGGAGGSGGGGNGGNGETALFVGSNGVTVTNTGTIRGGGGGGGGGPNGSPGHGSSFGSAGSCIGGSAGSGGAGGNGQGYNQSQSNGSGGSPGGSAYAVPSVLAGLCAANGGFSNGTGGGSGGNGGTYGNSGASPSGGGSGGSAGKYIKTGSGVSVSISNSGTLQGLAP